MNLYDTKDFFFVRSKDVISPGLQTLVIEKATTCICIEKDDRLLNTQHRSYRNEGSISGVIGVLNYTGINYLAVIS